MRYQLVLSAAGLVTLVDDEDFEVWASDDDEDFAADFDDIVEDEDLEDVEDYLREKGTIKEADRVEYIDELEGDVTDDDDAGFSEDDFSDDTDDIED